MRKIFLFLVALFAMNAMATEGALNGVFSVSADKKVVFSQGNLQYQASSKTWRFAEHQWEYVGGKNTGVVYENEEKCSNKLISDDYTGWIDLFGWGTGNAPTKKTENYADYTTFTDWGINKISNGGNADSLWRTLTADEWKYLIRERPNADSLFTYARVNGKVGTTDVYIDGVLLLPDDWVTPDGLTVKRLLAAGNDVSWKTATISAWYEAEWYEIKVNEPFTLNSYSDSQWQQLEAAGAVFLPKTFYRDSTTVQDLNISGYYWSTTQRPDYMPDALALHFTKTALDPRGTLSLHFGGAVRLVQDYDVTPNVFPDGNLPGKFSINADGDSIQFASGNLQYNPYYVYWQFATNQYDIIGADNKYINAPDEDDIIDLFGWGASGAYSTNDADYSSFNDWGTLAAEDMGLDGTWRTLTADEWNYILSTRPNAAQLKAKATVVGQTGLILLPDNWDLTSYPLNTTDNDYSANVFTQVQWIVWEAQGAVFLPAAGLRSNTSIYSLNAYGFYWSSSVANDTKASSVRFNASECAMYDAARSSGASVRLAREVLPTYKVTIVTENCSVTVEPESIDLNAVEQGTVLTLTAVPETNFRFKEWQNYNPETGLVVTSDTTITAICAKLWVVTKAEVTGGHVSITYRGTDHELTADELSSVPDGTMLTFTAIPDEGYRFVGWTPASAYASTTYIVNQPITYDFTVTPVFRRNGVFAVTIQPQYGGEVTCTTEGVNLEEVESGTKLTFKANPIAGWAVNRWAGSPNLVINYETTPDIAELTVTTDETITCYFAELPPAEAIDEIQSEEKAVKFIRNGQLFILRDGKTYNALGMEIK